LSLSGCSLSSLLGICNDPPAQMTTAIVMCGEQTYHETISASASGAKSELSNACDPYQQYRSTLQLLLVTVPFASRSVARLQGQMGVFYPHRSQLNSGAELACGTHQRQASSRSLRRRRQSQGRRPCMTDPAVCIYRTRRITVTRCPYYWHSHVPFRVSIEPEG
jgi:hypothetical protein